MNTPPTPQRPSWEKMHETLTTWHAQLVDDPIARRMSKPFEDFADVVYVAMKEHKAEQEALAYLESQVVPWFMKLSGEFDASTVRKV